jgi:NADH:ubiquinone oxidoreductase subunit F (NADH-binding)
MIESIEGKRGMPRCVRRTWRRSACSAGPRWNTTFETLYWVREHPGKRRGLVRQQGRNGRKGLRSFSVSGRVREPGVKLAPAGITIQELIDEYCGGMQDGHQLLCLPAGRRLGRHPAGEMNDIPLDFDTLQPYGCFIGSAAVVVLSDRTPPPRSAQPDALLPRRVLRPVHALPRGTAKALA